MNLKYALRCASMVGAMVFFNQNALADDWGCQVLLCLSDPRGPTTESQCQPPIEKLWDHLKKGKPFPSCEMAGDANNGTGSFARQVSDYYDPCPEGTKPARGAYKLTQGTLIPGQERFTFFRHGEKQYRKEQFNIAGPIVQGMIEDENGRPGGRACIGQEAGYYEIRRNYEDYENIYVYNQVVWQKPQSPRAIDVYITGKFYTRIRW